MHLRDVITFQGTTVEEMRSEFRESIDGYLEWCAERGEEPDKPFSGKLLLRMGPDLHLRAANASAKAKLSLNDWILRAMEEHLNAEKKPASIARMPKTAVRPRTARNGTPIGAKP